MAAYEEQEYNKPFSFRVWGKMLPFFKPYRKFFAITLGFNIFLAGIDVVVPLFQSYAIDHFITVESLEGIWRFAAAYVAVIVIQTMSVYFSVRAATTIEMNVGKDLKWAQFEHLQTLSFSYYNTTPVGYIHARVMSDTLRIATMVAWGLVDMFWALIYVISVFVIMFLLNVRLALVILLIVPCIAVLTVYFQNRILHWNRKVRKINSQITSAYNEGITGVKTSKSMVIERDNEKAFFERTSEMYRASVRSARLNAVYIPTILLFGSVAAAVVLAQGGYMVKEEIMRLGTLSVFISYAVIIFEPIQQLARLLAELISCQANIERVMDLLEQEPNVVDKAEVIKKYGDAFHPKKENWEKIKGDIVFEDVSFRYPDGKEFVLEHFSLHVPAGMNVAIVGETGAGKSTLVNLVGRFFEPTYGRILIDGVDYRERSQLWLHSQIGYVLQNPHLFSGTVRENIRYGRLDATDEEIEEAARNVSADEVVMKLEKGYDSDVGESGGRLSTGEKQLISFARAILANPSIFVLDEATSSIDTHTEQLLQQATGRLLRGHTSFIIAHRLSTIRQADLILVVKDGKIIEQGTHKELLREKGYYYELYSKQFEEEASMKVFAGGTI
ncbi:ATP-binding cassette domain-containing protein [Lachnospiraceae bacterium WCA-9-b2]|uniref:ATP-binding cassette domain-containing protein n=1 Tax=Sporofaciens musculi TaxID=2681861 RepID=A0A7X3MJA5_9FIRM|nr:ABC transporter ATP-binding protein [Sporofaciens musculi]MCI9422260.1 ABC transporter ATP-binding protein [Dorea sp.]MXP77407.1 ATP-binding cassette domain-containing protein [Sporofaciens musculi]